MHRQRQRDQRDVPIPPDQDRRVLEPSRPRRLPAREGGGHRYLTEQRHPRNFPDPETILEEEPFGRFLLQFTLYGAMNSAPFGARTYRMPAASFDALWPLLRPLPLSPFLPTYEAEKFFAAPGLLARASADDNEAIVSFAALHRGTLTPLLDHGFRWVGFDG